MNIKKIIRKTFFLSILLHNIVALDGLYIDYRTDHPMPVFCAFFDFNGVLGHVSKTKCMRNIGLCNALLYTVRARELPGNYALYSILNEIPSSYEGNKWGMKDDKGEILPDIFVDWQRGLIDSQTLYNALVESINHTYHDCRRYFLQSLAKMLCTPQIFAETIIINEEVFGCAYALKQKGYRLCLFSNFDRETFSIVYKKYEKNFRIFDDIIISGEAGMVKPDPAFFEYAKNRNKASSYILFDDQKENCDAARMCGIRAIQWQSTKTFFLFQRMQEYQSHSTSCVS